MLRHDERTAGPIGFDDLGIERMILLCQDRKLRLREQDFDLRVCT